MTDKEKKELKDGVISIFKRFNILDHTATIGSLRDDILRYINSLPEEPVSEDLEKEIGKYCSNPENFITYIDVGFKQSPIEKDDIPLIIKAIKFGAKWQKEQLMKDAISAKVTEIYYPTDSCLEIEATLPEGRFKDGDKVLIIKED